MSDEKLLNAKKKYKKLYRYYAPNGIEIDYRPLSWDEYNAYIESIRNFAINEHLAEESIFEACVLNDIYVSSIDLLDAGTVLTVVNLILQQSGPQSADNIAEDLNAKRDEIGSITNQIISIICQAFPGYTPDDIDKMSWDRMMSVFVLAEHILIERGVLEGHVKISGAKARMKVNAGPIDFNAANREIADLGPPPGDWNLHRARSQ